MGSKIDNIASFINMEEVNDDNVEEIVSKKFCKKPAKKRAKKLKREYTCNKCHTIFYEASDLERHCGNPQECDGADVNSHFIIDTKKKYNRAHRQLEYQLQRNQLTEAPINEMERCANILESMGAMDQEHYSHVLLTLSGLREGL